MEDSKLYLIMKGFRNRAQAFGLKPGTKKYNDEQASFFYGAMTALEDDPDIRIIIPIMFERDILEEHKEIIKKYEEK